MTQMRAAWVSGFLVGVGVGVIATSVWMSVVKWPQAVAGTPEALGAETMDRCGPVRSGSGCGER